MSRLEERGLLFVFRERFLLMGFVSLATSVSGITFLCVVVAGLHSFGIAPLIHSRAAKTQQAAQALAEWVNSSSAIVMPAEWYDLTNQAQGCIVPIPV